MALFDSLTSEVSERFKLGDKGGALVSALLNLIVSNSSKGLHNFLDQFRRAGLGETANSWVSIGANSALSNQQTEDALGTDKLSELASQTDIPFATAAAALSYLIPTVIDKLTPNGIVPDNYNLREALRSYLPNPSGGAIAETANRAEPTGLARVSTMSDGNSALRFLLPLLLLGLLGFVGYQFCGKPNQNVAVFAPNNNLRDSTSVSATTAKIDPRVSIRAENARYFVTGTVASQAEKKQITEVMRRELGEANVDFANLRIDSNAKSAGWLTKFAELVPTLKNWTSGTLTFEGENRLAAAGNVPPTVIDKIKSLFPGWTLPAFFLGTGAEAQRAANEQAAAALKSAATPEQVVDALNLSIVNFATGKSDVPADNQKILEEAAKVLKTAAIGTTIEIGGHTDNVGNAASNQKLSEDRANSVKNELIKLGVNAANLNAKGYGDTKPKADNTTDAGKFQNRRIEYTLTSASGASTTINSNTTVTTTSNSNSSTHASGH